MAKQRWSSEEIDFLRTNFESKSNEQLANALGRTAKSIGVKASKLGLRRIESYSMQSLRH